MHFFKKPKNYHFYKDNAHSPIQFMTRSSFASLESKDEIEKAKEFFNHPNCTEFSLNDHNEISPYPHPFLSWIARAVEAVINNALRENTPRISEGYMHFSLDNNILYSGYFVKGEFRLLYKTHLEFVKNGDAPLVRTELVPLKNMKQAYYDILYPLNGLISDYLFDKNMRNIPTRKLLRSLTADTLRLAVRDFITNDGLELRHLNKLTPECLQLLVDEKETVHILIKHHVAKFDQISQLNLMDLEKLLKKPNDLASQNLLLDLRRQDHCSLF